MYWFLVWPLIQLYKLIKKAITKNAAQPEASAPPAAAAPEISPAVDTSGEHPEAEKENVPEAGTQE